MTSRSRQAGVETGKGEAMGQLMERASSNRSVACGQQRKEASRRPEEPQPRQWAEQGARAGNSLGGPGCEGHGMERKVLISETQEMGTPSAHM